jgi:hypothetical protein
VAAVSFKPKSSPTASFAARDSTTRRSTGRHNHHRWVASSWRSVVPLDEQSLLDHAQRNTGLPDFESDGWLDHLRVLLETIHKEAKPHFIGRYE